MTADWSSLPEETRAVTREVVADLLHDWIKYMEMRLLSIDWSALPENVESVVDRSIRRTRRAGAEVRGARQLWEAGRARLVALPAGEPLTGLIEALDGDVAALEGLLERARSDLQVDGAAVEAVVRRPGRRLRAVRDSLCEESEPY